MSFKLTDKERFLINFEGQDFSKEGKNFIKVRELALEFLKESEFPTTKDELWKYTSVNAILKDEFKPLSSINNSNVDAHKIPGLDAYRMVFINGFFAAHFSDTFEDEHGECILMNINAAKGKFGQFMENYFGTLAKAKASAFNALNAAYSQDGVYLHVTNGVKLDKPVHILFLNEGAKVSSQPRNLIVVGKNAKAEVIVSYDTIETENALTNSISEFVVLDGGKLTVNKLQYENDNTYHISTDSAYQQKNSEFHINTFPLSGKLIRNNLHIQLDGAAADAKLYALNYLTGKEHVDNQTYVEHVKPHCTSTELYKSVVNDESTSVFNGKIKVHKDAQKTQAFQSNANIINDDNAKAYAKPELEIYADDVKCSHGSTTGQFDNEALFYLRARGIKESSAKKLLLDAFASEVLDAVENGVVREFIEKKIEKKIK
ncbi:MAG: Fe-S cluster assembly protein SufD [Flavobacteriales bacterium]